ncbi:hypothetical protein D6C87_03132 [Aureobasidium pullulans]|uniref:Uncharacterized protein n=1 Tax=Aureobasidium pullulans TaxID=5580 RepID=A0AB38M5H6_AURPU|nr:hypothetical protein D6C94_02176 [Aureobasidium pullulans]THZ45092.1 hypothetical protein D6C87_03132 [Aureobasidium pullulans]
MLDLNLHLFELELLDDQRDRRLFIFIPRQLPKSNPYLATMRFAEAFAIAGLSASLVTALPVASSENSKRALVAPLSDGKGNGLVESLGVLIDSGFTTVLGGVVAPAVEGGEDQPEVNAKRALIAPLSDGKGNGLIEGLGQLTDVAFTAVGTAGGAAVEGGEDQPEVNAKRALVAPFSDGKGNGLAESVGQVTDVLFTAVGTAGGAAVEGGEDQPEVNA